MQPAHTKTLTLGRFVSRLVSSLQAGFENKIAGEVQNRASRGVRDKGLRETGIEPATAPGVVICSAAQVLGAHSRQPVIVAFGPSLALLTMLRCLPRRNRTRWHQLCRRDARSPFATVRGDRCVRECAEIWPRNCRALPGGATRAVKLPLTSRPRANRSRSCSSIACNEAWLADGCVTLFLSAANRPFRTH